ncbi:MAG: glycosyltransferase family 4 protein [Acidimicrobiales bacterium]
MTHRRPPASGTGLRMAHVVRSDNFAGVERYITYVAPELAGRGLHVVVIGGDPARMAGALAPAGIEYRPATTTLQVARQLLACRPLDLVHTHMSAAEVAALVTRPLTGAPLVTTRHFAARRGRSTAGRVAALAVARTVAVEIAISRFVADAIGEPSVVLPSGVPRTDRAPTTPDRRPVVLMAQRLEREKDSSVGLRAWAASGLAAAGWRLVVAGGGALAGELRDLAGALGAGGSVDFVGPQADIGRLFESAGVLLATAPEEPFGLSVVEAMAAALPVVASGSGAHLETVGACSARWLFPAGDHEACAQRLRELALAPATRQAYGDALQAFQRRHFDLGDHVDRLVELYLGVTGRRPPAAVR